MAVVPVVQVATVAAHTARLHPDTSFLMQLLATNADAPQTRKFRQADPAEGSARYQTAQPQPRSPRYSKVV